jgi:hypothetical protein
MAEEPGSILLRYLRRIDEKLDPIACDLRDACGVADRISDTLSGIFAGTAALDARFARLETRLDHIERRLDLVATAGG